MCEEWGWGGSFNQGVKGSLGEDATFLQRLERSEDALQRNENIPMRTFLQGPGGEERAGGSPRERAGQACLPSAGLGIQDPPVEPDARAGFKWLSFHLPSQTIVPALGHLTWKILQL